MKYDASLVAELKNRLARHRRECNRCFQGVFCPEKDRLLIAINRAQDLAIAALVKRLSAHGQTLEIGIALNVDHSVDQYRVEWRDEMTEIVTWNEDLLQALIKTDADVAAVANYS